MSLREVRSILNCLGSVRRDHNWVYKADLQPISTVSDQLAVDEKIIRLHGQKFWLYGAVEYEQILHVSLIRPQINRRHDGFDRATGAIS